MRTSRTLAMISALMITAAVGLKGEDGTDNDGQKRGGQGHLIKSGELKAYRAKQIKTRREFMKKQKEANKAFRKTLKEKEPKEILNAIIANRKSQVSETKAFMDGLYNDFVSHAKELMEKKDIPEDKQSKFLSKLEEHRTEALNKHKEIYEKLIQALEELKSNENLTKEDIKKTISEILPDRKNKRGKGRKKSEESE